APAARCSFALSKRCSAASICVFMPLIFSLAKPPLIFHPTYVAMRRRGTSGITTSGAENAFHTVPQKSGSRSLFQIATQKSGSRSLLTIRPSYDDGRPRLPALLAVPKQTDLLHVSLRLCRRTAPHPQCLDARSPEATARRRAYNCG